MPLDITRWKETALKYHYCRLVYNEETGNYKLFVLKEEEFNGSPINGSPIKTINHLKGKNYITVELAKIKAVMNLLNQNNPPSLENFNFDSSAVRKLIPKLKDPQYHSYPGSYFVEILDSLPLEVYSILNDSIYNQKYFEKYLESEYNYSDVIDFKEKYGRGIHMKIFAKDTIYIIEKRYFRPEGLYFLEKIPGETTPYFNIKFEKLILEMVPQWKNFMKPLDEKDIYTYYILDCLRIAHDILYPRNNHDDFIEIMNSIRKE
jgi:hypothetical protein